jgi:hypothetical protein
MDNNPINLNDVLGDMPSDGGDSEKHTVKSRETLGGIAKKNGVSID